MSETSLTPEVIREITNAPVLARVATADPRTLQPHVVPVWFLWDGTNVWISSFSSTRKVRDLKANQKCTILVDGDKGSTNYWAIYFEGQVELIIQPRSLVEEMSTQIYTRYLGEEGVLAADPQSWIHDAENLLIKLTPTKIYGSYAA